MKIVCSCVVSFSLLSLAVSAQAQYAPAFYGPGPGWGGGSYRHASTAEEGIARGLGEVIRSAGAANLMHSEAAKNWEDARRMNIDNRLHRTQTYFEMRRVNRQARWAERPPKPTQQDLIRYAQARNPNRLNPTELDPVTGTIVWPQLVLLPQFDADRTRLEELYAERARNGYLSPDQMLEVNGVARNMQEVLKADLQAYPPQLYTQTKNFLESLAYESFMRPG